MKIAVSRLHLPDGEILHNQVIEIQNDKVVAFHSLTTEEPFVSWQGGDYYLANLPQT